MFNIIACSYLCLMDHVAGAILSGFLLLSQISDVPRHKILNTVSEFLGSVVGIMAEEEAQSQRADLRVFIWEQGGMAVGIAYLDHRRGEDEMG